MVRLRIGGFLLTFPLANLFFAPSLLHILPTVYLPLGSFLKHRRTALAIILFTNNLLFIKIFY